MLLEYYKMDKPFETLHGEECVFKSNICVNWLNSVPL